MLCTVLKELHEFGSMYFTKDKITCQSYMTFMRQFVYGTYSSKMLPYWSGQIKDYKIGIYCLFAKHATLSRKRKDWLARNQNNVSEWSGMSIRGMLFQ